MHLLQVFVARSRARAALGTTKKAGAEKQNLTSKAKQNQRYPPEITQLRCQRGVVSGSFLQGFQEKLRPQVIPVHVLAEQLAPAARSEERRVASEGGERG